MHNPNAIRTIAIVSLMIMASTLIPQELAAKDTPPQLPFELDRNRVIIPTSVNGSRSLRLILDTGMRFDGVYLFHRQFTNEIDMTDAIEVRVPGAGSGEASTTTMIESGQLTFGPVTVDSQKVIISHSAHTQSFPTDGVIGWNLFGHYTVEIDYDRELIILHDSDTFTPDSTWTSIPITMKKDLPFFDAILSVTDDDTVSVTLYIDLASGDALELLVSEDQRFAMPDSLKEDYLGTGLSGDIHGSSGRVKRLAFSGYSLTDISTKFAPAKVRSKQEGADGILGNDCMRRFNTIYDYRNSQLHLKPSKHYSTPFE